jgi:hypothetical protein
MSETEKKKQIMIHEDTQILFDTKWKKSNPITRCHHDDSLFSNIIVHDLIYCVVECLIECEISNFMSSIGFISHNDIRITNRCDSVRILNMMYQFYELTFNHSELEIFEFHKSTVSRVENFDVFHVSWLKSPEEFYEYRYDCECKRLSEIENYKEWYVRIYNDSINPNMRIILLYNDKNIQARLSISLLGINDFCKLSISAETGDVYISRMYIHHYPSGIGTYDFRKLYPTQML